MAMQDLTPQLRTRLSRVEKVVGWFVTIATLLLLAGLAFYIYSVAQNKGWFKTKAPYFLTLRSGGGLQPGDKVMLMGAPVGEVTKVDFFPPDAVGNVYVAFVVYEPNYGYVWDDSYVRVNSAGFLGQRYLEIIKGGTSGAKDLHATYKEESGRLVAQWSRDRGEFVPWRWGNEPYELDAYEPPELGTQLDEMVQTVKVSLTNILALTNDLARTLSGAATATENLNELLAAARPLVTNATIITENLTPPRGSLG
jgi:ABC-type transporter Mla subunit MlaD